MRIQKICTLLALVGASLAGSFSAMAACPGNKTLSPGQDLTAAIQAACAGETITLNSGTYVASTFLGQPTFPINQRVRIVGATGNPANVILQAAASDYAVRFMAYVDTGGQPADAPNGATLESVTITGAPYGVLVDDYAYASYTTAPSRFTDVTLKNVVINAGSGDGIVSGGVSGLGAQRLTLDGVTISAGGIGINLRNTIDSVVVNSTVNSNAGTTALFVNGGKNNVFVGNTFGKAPTATGTTLSSTNVAFQNTQGNRFEGNVVQGHATDAVAFYNASNGDTTLQTLDNYAGKNTVLSNGWAATQAGIPNRSDGTGIWVNCSANNTWVYGNDVSGGPEAGLTIWTSKSNAFIGNVSHNNQHAGLFISGGTDLYTYCGPVAYQQRAVRNWLQSNSVFFNQNDNIIVRNTDFADVSLNFVSPQNGFGGAFQTTNGPAGQSFVAFDGTGGIITGNRALRNTSVNTPRGLWIDDGNSRQMQFFGNRVIGSQNNREMQSSTFTTLDWGATLGGNYWSQFASNGNPGTIPFTSISDSPGNVSTGYASDRFPYQSESFGITTLTVAEPFAGDYAIGSVRTVRWLGLGCTFVDLMLDGTTALKTNAPNTGYAIVTVPSTTQAAHFVQVVCKNSAGQPTGASTNSATFNVTANSLQLLSPGRDDVFNAGQTIPVAWKRNGGFSGAVTVELSLDGGTTWTQPAGWTTTFTGDVAYLTIPSGFTSTAYNKVRITSGTARDTNDGVFAIHGSSGSGFRNVTSRTFRMGSVERLEWASPSNSRLVTITYNTGSTSGTVVTDFPDRGSFDWIVPDVGATTNLVLSIQYKTSTGTNIGTPSNSSASTTAYTGTPGQSALSVTVAGSGTVTSAPAGISCPPTCDASFANGTTVTLSAVAGSGSQFANFSGACSGTSCTLSMTGNKGVSASFYTGTLVQRYRLYSPATAEHLYTTNFFEYQYLSNQIDPACCSWSGEGPIYRIFSTAGATYGSTAAVPYFRLYNPVSHQHHWTTALVEYNFLPSVGWQQEGIDGYILPSAEAGALPLYRLYTPAAGGLHLWTTDAFERDYLSTNAGWQYEGISGYVVP